MFKRLTDENRDRATFSAGHERDLRVDVEWRRLNADLIIERRESLDKKCEEGEQHKTHQIENSCF